MRISKLDNNLALRMPALVGDAMKLREGDDKVTG